MLPPRGVELPVVVEVPHAGLLVDAICLSTLLVSARALARDADLFVDELVPEVTEVGATVLIARTSRYFIDLNRRDDEVDRHAVEGGLGHEAPHGLIWHRATDGERALAAPLPRCELERRLDLIYRPYHATLQRLLDEKRKRFGHVILVCAHSMPSHGLSFTTGKEVARADVVPGTRGKTSAAAPVIETVDRFARAFGFTVKHDDPYRGGYSTQHYGAPARGVHAVQIEVARRLYMHESTLHRDPDGIARLRRFYRELALRLGGLIQPVSVRR
ncbi:MAG: N-formylglutamate amidohydrolase [Myxococcales bacterium]|nr:N-formylglutamate amidohydrolase [Polyangiaceae bacterium]MDW8248806.1 N-formylglutamate amidohydrolase [Myxococcales bacterium]